MQHRTAVAVPIPSALRRGLAIVGLTVIFLLSGALGFAGGARAASATSTAAAPLKAVIIVGPTHGYTSSFLERGEVLARSAASYGMDVRRVFHPNATAENVLANVQGANLVAYIGHGNGWPSPYGSFQEKTKNGLGLNPYAGGSASNVQYYGGNWIRNNVVLAPNAVVLLNGLCYAGGNGEAGMAIPSWDIARQRVDNFAAAFLAVGSKGVFAYSWQPGASVIRDLFTTSRTFEQIFTGTGWRPHPSYGFVGWDARKFESVRSPGATNYLDPHETAGFLRAFSGDPSVTAAQWASAAPDATTPDGDAAPDTDNAAPDPGTSPVAPDTAPPSAPQALTAEPLGYRRIALSWQPSTDDREGTIRYRIFRNRVRIKTVTTPSFTDRPPYARTYSYKIRAVDAAGNRSVFTPVVTADAVKGPLSAAAPFTAPDTTPPSAPEGLTATAKARRWVSLTWTASSDDHEGAVRYRLLRNGRRIATVTTTSVMDRPPTVGEYTYRVRAVDAAGNRSAFSATVVVTAVRAV